MNKSETAWSVDIDYAACGQANGSKARMERARRARSSVREAGYRDSFICRDYDTASDAAMEITTKTGVPMRVGECVVGMWPA